MKKMKIIVVLLLVLLLGIGFISMQKDDYREKEVKDIKKKYMSLKIKECLSKQKISIKNATAEQKEKCKLNLDEQWEEAKVLNSEY